MDWRNPISRLVMAIGILLAMFSIGAFYISYGISNGWNLLFGDTTTKTDVELIAQIFVIVGIGIGIVGAVIKWK